MADEKQDFTIDAHKKFAVDFFNGAWGLIDKKDRTREEDIQMIQMAHASAHHWLSLKGHVDESRSLVAPPRSANQLANVYLRLNRPEPALYHAQYCVDYCEEHGIGDWDIAFAYQCLAHAHHIADDNENRDKNLKLAHDAGSKIEKDGDKNFFMETLEKTPGYSEIKGNL